MVFREKRKSGLGSSMRGTFLRSAVLAAGLALGGCGDTINNYYYTGPDGGPKVSDSMPKPDSGKPDSLKPDSLKPDACVASKEQLACATGVPLASGLLNVSEALNLGTRYRLVLDDLEPHDDVTNAIVSLTDSCGNILTKDKIAQGQKKTVVFLDGPASDPNSKVVDTLEITATDIAAGYAYGAKWAKFNVEKPCGYWCAGPSGILNQYESLTIDNIKVQLDDIVTVNNVPKAAISILDANGNVLMKDTIPEGTGVEKDVGGKRYLISVKKVAPGYTFGAKWAEIEISGKVDTPCGS